MRRGDETHEPVDRLPRLCYNGRMNKLSSLKTATEVRVIKIGNSKGVILPKDVLAQLGVAQGDTVDVIAKDGGVFLRKQDIGFADQMAAAREVMRKRRDALRELAK